MRALLYSCILGLLLTAPGDLWAGKAEKQLLKAVKADDLERARVLLGDGADANHRAGGETLLMCAVKYGSKELVDSLVAHGARVDEATRAGNVVTRATRLGRISVLRDMIARGGSVAVSDRDGYTPLMFAVVNNDLEMARLILSADPELNWADNNGDTALHHAVKNSNFRMVDLLLGHGADHELEDRWGNTPLAFAKFMRCTTSYDLFLLHKREPMPKGYAPLFRGFKEELEPTVDAAIRGDLSALETLLENEDKGVWAMIAAVRRQRLETVRFLLARGIDPNITDRHGAAPLGLAVKFGDEALIRLLLDNGARIFCREDGVRIRVAEDAANLKELENFKKRYSFYHDRRDPEPRRKKVARVRDKGVVAPVFTQRVQPKFPRGQRQGGKVILEAILGKNGTIYDIRVLRALNNWKHGFEASAIAALKQWQYTPGTINGKPTDVRMTLAVDFVLR